VLVCTRPTWGKISWMSQLPTIENYRLLTCGSLT